MASGQSYRTVSPKNSYPSGCKCDRSLSGRVIVSVSSRASTIAGTSFQAMIWYVAMVSERLEQL